MKATTVLGLIGAGTVAAVPLAGYAAYKAVRALDHPLMTSMSSMYNDILQQQSVEALKHIEESSKQISNKLNNKTPDADLERINFIRAMRDGGFVKRIASEDD